MAEIKQNLVFLSENITNLKVILVYLHLKEVISKSEWERIEYRETSLERNERLLTLLVRKDWELIKPQFLRILRKTSNHHCADKIEDASKWDLKYSLKFNAAGKEEPVLSKGVFTSGNTNALLLKEISHPIWFEVTAPTKFYVGREEEMKSLERYWSDCLENKIFTIVSVTGLGGLGKSELARNFAKRFYEVMKGHCIWIEAETDQSLVESFQNLAEKTLEISVNDYLGKKKKFLDIVDEVYKKLFGEKVLLIFDNLENFGEPVLLLLFRLSSQQPPTVLKPFVITTSRLIEAQKYFGPQCNHIDLHVLIKESALDFFYKSLHLSKHPEDGIRDSIERLCERLQFFPLAMQQAAAYINDRSLYCGTLCEAITNYLTQMEKMSKTLLDYKLPTGYDSLEKISNTTLLTWKITFDKLRKCDDSRGIAIDIINIISFLSPDHISNRLLCNILHKMGKISKGANIDYCFHLIRKYSIINYFTENVITVHRLVQEVSRIELEERGELQAILSVIVKCLMEMLIAEQISLKELVHVQMVWHHLGKQRKEMIDDHGGLLGLICKKLYESKKYRDIVQFSSESGELLENALGQKSRWTLQMNYWKGKALRKLGEHSESSKVLQDVCEKQKQVFGEEDTDYLLAVNEVTKVLANLRNLSSESKEKQTQSSRLVPSSKFIFILASSAFVVILLAIYMGGKEESVTSKTNSISRTSLEKHYLYLAEHLSDHISLKNHLLHHKIISSAESEKIFHASKGAREMNSDLLEVLIRKDWSRIETTVIQIFKETGNLQCAEALLS